MPIESDVASVDITEEVPRHSVKKQRFRKKLFELVENHTQVLIVDVANVGSRQLGQIRFALRGKATILMGKNTMIKTLLRQKVGEIPQLENLIPLIKENVGLIFCACDLSEIHKTITEHRVPAPAKQGAVAPCDVIVPAGPTGLDPGQTSFFQVLQIATKIVKGQVEIQNPVQIISEGTKVSASQSVLLAKLNIKPFSYGLKPVSIYDDGAQYPATVLEIKHESLVERVKTAVQMIAAFSLASSIPTKPSAPHSITRAVRELKAFALAAEIEV